MNPVSIPCVPRGFAVTLSCLAIASAGGCGTEPAELEGPIDEDTYVVVMSELADLQRFPPSGPADRREALADSARLAILERYGVTADELLTYAELAGAEPDRMQRITERIVDVTDSLAQARTGREVPEDTLSPGVADRLEAARADADSPRAAPRIPGRSIEELRRSRDAGETPRGRP